MTKRLRELPHKWGWGNACGGDQTVDMLAKRVRVLENSMADLLTLLDEDGTVEATRGPKGHLHERDT